MITNCLRSLAVAALLLVLLNPARSRAAADSFRLVYIGSLSGYVKLCG